jgi:hypothetical protein
MMQVNKIRVTAVKRQDVFIIYFSFVKVNREYMELTLASCCISAYLGDHCDESIGVH